MKHLLLIAGLICSFGVQAQVTGISVETYMVHDGVSINELAGYTTYHVYANTTTADDFVSAVYGDSDNPLFIEVTGDIFHSAPGFDYGSEANPSMFEFFPQLEYDSWMTIGMLNATDNGVLGNVGVDQAMADFAATGSFLVDDAIGGSWYNTIPCDPATSDTCSSDYPQFGGANNKVLLAQITTNGTFCGVFNLQVFDGGDQTQNQYVNALGFCSTAGEIFGCIDPAATNYDPTATQDDFSCTLPCALELVIESVVSPSCNGDNDGSINVTATGAQGSDDYYLGETDTVPTNFGIFNDMYAGTYYVMVQDGAGCQSEAYIEIPATPLVTVTATLEDGISCNNSNDAVIELSGMGGTGTLEYYTAGEDASTATPNSTITDLAEGNYSFVAIDENGCTGVSNVVPINNPSAVSIFVTGVADASCADVADGQIVVTAGGGVAPETIVYEVDGTTYDASPIYISGGTYTVTAIDINGCTTTSEEIVIGPDAITVNATSTPVLCSDEASGEITWNPVGGVGGFEIVVDGVVVTGDSYGNLLPGFYTVVALDNNLCSAAETIEVMNADQIETSTEVTDALCDGSQDGIVVVSATGGAGSFQYSTDGNDFYDSSEFDGLYAGQYTFYAQDANGCIVGANAVVGEPNAIDINAIASVGDVTGEGSIDVTVLGGTPDYDYLWFGPGVDGVSTQDLDGLSTGTYIIQVTDDNLCTMSETIQLVTSVDEIEGGIHANVFPNPSNGVFNVQWSGWTGGDVLYTITDATGRVVESGAWQGAGSEFNTQIDLGTLENGVYRLSIDAENVVNTIQLIKVQ